MNLGKTKVFMNLGKNQLCRLKVQNNNQMIKKLIWYNMELIEIISKIPSIYKTNIKKMKLN